LVSRSYHTDDEDGHDDDGVNAFARQHIDNLPARTSSQFMCNTISDDYKIYLDTFWLSKRSGYSTG